MVIMKSDKYRDIGEAVREKLFPRLQGCRIAWLVSDEAKKRSSGRRVFADCMKISKKRYEWCCDYDFMITVYQPNCDEYYFDDRRYAILLEHELMHVGYDPETGDCTLVPHDSEEFIDIIRKYGIDWQEPREEEPEPESEPESESEEKPEAEHE